MSNPEDIDTASPQAWIRERLSTEEVRSMLAMKGHDEESILKHIDVFRRVKYEKRRWKGFVCMSAGALTGFISCVLSLVNPIPELYGIFLYGLTSAAIIIVVAGLYLVFE